MRNSFANLTPLDPATMAATFVSRCQRNVCSRKLTFSACLDDVPNGIISCIASGNKMFASGSFSKLIGLFDSASLENIATLQGQQGGVTHLLISPDDNRLYSGARKVGHLIAVLFLHLMVPLIGQDNEILCWDLRNYGTVLHVINRTCGTNQRCYFDINFEHNLLVTGDDEGQVKVFDLNGEPSEDKALACGSQFEAHRNCVNGVGCVPIDSLSLSLTLSLNRNNFHSNRLHPSLPLMATTSGQRCLVDFNETDDDIMFDYNKSYIKDTNLKLWWFR